MEDIYNSCYLLSVTSPLAFSLGFSLNMSLENKGDGIVNDSEKLDTDIATIEAASSIKVGWMKKLSTWGVEERG